VYQFITDVFRLSQSQSGPFLIHDLSLGNTPGVTSGAETDYPSGFCPLFSVGFVLPNLQFSV
jgi:hypothetical protein